MAELPDPLTDSLQYWRSCRNAAQDPVQLLELICQDAPKNALAFCIEKGRAIKELEAPPELDSHNNEDNVSSSTVDEDENRNQRKLLSQACYAACQFMANATAASQQLDMQTQKRLQVVLFTDKKPLLDLVVLFGSSRKILSCVVAIMLNCTQSHVFDCDQIVADRSLVCALLRAMAKDGQRPRPRSEAPNNGAAANGGGGGEARGAAAAAVTGGEGGEEDPAFEWLYLLLCALLARGRGPALHAAAGAAAVPFTPEQLVLAQVMEDYAGDETVGRSRDCGAPFDSPEQVDFLAGVLGRDLCACPAAAAAGAAAAGVGAAAAAAAVAAAAAGGALAGADLAVARALRPPGRLALLGALGGALARCGPEVLRHVAAAESADGASLPVLPLVLGILRETTFTGAPPAGAAAAGGEEGAEGAAAAAHPDYGVKTACLRVLANACHGNPPCQDRLRELGAIPLVLSHCRYDAANPLLREWGVVAVRALCASCPANQAAVEALEPQGLAPDALAAATGVAPPPPPPPGPGGGGGGGGAAGGEGTAASAVLQAALEGRVRRHAEQLGGSAAPGKETSSRLGSEEL